MLTAQRLSGFVLVAATIASCTVLTLAEEPVSYSTSDSRGAARIRKLLEEKTSLEFIETPLTDVVEFIKAKHNLEIQIYTKSLAESSIDPLMPVTCSLKDVTLRSTLRFILRQAGLMYVIVEDVLVVTAQTHVDTFLETRFYPVGDLVHRSEAGRMQGKEPEFDSLIHVITATVQPTTWANAGGLGAIRSLPDAQVIVLRQTGDIHGEVEQLLTTLRKAKGKQTAQMP
jgi:hypothetical protein